ncbi:MAG TPA: hypothetical protein QF555_04815 [Candidatus Thalassarchaeaceae archaeon]|nr:hypothetical protein [Candidatus Thalassarchaeaceae archaeon]
MAFLPELSRLLIAMFIAWFFTRIPLVILPRISIRTLDLVDHPNPPEVNEFLILQILRIRRAYWASIPFGLIPLVLGIIMLNQSPSSVGFGLIVGSSWVILSRIVPFDLDPMFRFPYSMNLIHELNRIRVESYPCCKSSNPFWFLDSVRCSSCSHILLDYPRPDLGRTRIDGWLWGSLRVMILDGHSLSESNLTTNSEEE